MKCLIIGFGNMAKVHINILKQFDSLEILGVVESDKSKHPEILANDLIPFTNLNQTEETIDFIDICTPTFTHYDLIIQSFEKTQWIIVEKPLVRTLDNVNQLRNYSKKSKILLAENDHYNQDLESFYNYTSLPKLIHFKRFVDLEYFLKGSTPWFLDFNKSGGIVLDLLIHDLNLVIGKYGKPLKISNVIYKQEKYDQIDNVLFKLQYSKFEAIIEGTWTLKNSEKPIISTIEIAGKLIIKNENLLTHAKNDPYLNELSTFINIMKGNEKIKYDIDKYLDANEIALEVNKLIYNHE